MSTFTALNGGSPRPAEAMNGTADAERGPGQSAPADPRPAAAESSTTSQRHDRLPFPGQSSLSSASGQEASHKRKRSNSESPTRERQPSPASRRERSERTDLAEATERAGRSEPGDRPELYGAQRVRSETRDGYSTPRRESYRGYGDERRDERREDADHWHSRETREERNSSYEGPYSAGPVSAVSDDQPGDRHRRATSQGDSADYGDQSPDGDDRGMYSGQYTPEQRRDGVIQSDPKKRKRNFSNRTKTGCLTCRKRKKKCDETKPECNNCIRGGFVCAGYPPQRGTWQKPEAKPAQVTIESKDPNYVPPGAYGMPQQPPYPREPLPGPPSKRDSIAYNRVQPTLRITPPQGRPLQSDDDRLTASTLPSSVLSPDNKLSALSSAYTSSASAMFPTPISAVTNSALSDRAPKEYQRVPPLHDLTRTDPEQQQQQQQQQQQSQQSQPPPSASAPPPPPPPPQSTTVAHPPYSFHTGRTATPPTAQAAPPAPPPSSSVGGSSGGPQATAQLALSHTQFPSDRPRREKEEMLNGRQYYPFDKELVLERERCNAACWRFNNSTNPNIGVSPAERARLFRDILHPREGVHLSPTLMSPVTHTGRVGDNTAVEAPFNCDYGYNIQIGNNVSIGRNCLINDVCEVRIGSNVIISPNVCIYTGTCSTDPRRRAGNSGTQYGKPVVIEDDVWIAANVVILPGVRIGRGSTVGAGSVVTRDVATYSIYMGLKAGHRRGIAFV
ncbi:hypothetical protein QC763_402530 [Podospora pseudopauciseta]|uniref:Zn(2)-C6 fungal-type domain-containing protein n=1 Tax=Podospora pseudopauciseta TaxID=2093780 RepID=A0ABR0HBU6_9PEZI|nr:hypothetical protein QC763_402530 [Podospora pseudopauciseta]